jgi:Lar family restriction alleviation protein
MVDIDAGIELLPCPCCGGEARFGTEYDQTALYRVYCRGCGIRTSKDASSHKVVTAWNKRADCIPTMVRVGDVDLSSLGKETSHALTQESPLCGDGHTYKIIKEGTTAKGKEGITGFWYHCQCTKCGEIKFYEWPSAE